MRNFASEKLKTIRTMIKQSRNYAACALSNSSRRAQNMLHFRVEIETSDSDTECVIDFDSQMLRSEEESKRRRITLLSEEGERDSWSWASAEAVALLRSKEEIVLPVALRRTAGNGECRMYIISEKEGDAVVEKRAVLTLAPWQSSAICSVSLKN